MQLDTQMLFATASLSCGALNTILAAFTTAGDHGLVWLIAAAVLLLNKQTRKTGWMLLFSIALAYIIGDTIIKETVMRARPFQQIEGISLLIPPPDGYSFPSGHTSSSFAALVVFYAAMPKMRIPAMVYALLIAFSRVYFMVHFPFDVLAGALLGIGCAYFVMAIFRRRKLPIDLYALDFPTCRSYF
ncbi:MAG: phosphatase PAP2 family protein [Christensenella sp.]|nr:phosphatase PAP2 family protein [Christensenella sp.]